MTLTVGIAADSDAAAIAAVRSEAARNLTARFGAGLWSAGALERGVRWHMRRGPVVVAREDGVVVGALALSRRRPASIERKPFTKVRRPAYLSSMAVEPRCQRRGVGRALMTAAEEVGRRQGFGAIRLDAYDAEAGAGPFYLKCGYRECARAPYAGTGLIYFERLLT